MTYYDILGVPPDASTAEIRSAYRKLARRYHPDAQPGLAEVERATAEENLRAVNAAYHTLSDPYRREQYQELMWTRRDPARDYRYSNGERQGRSNSPAGEGDFSSPRGARPAGASDFTSPRPAKSAAVFLEILRLRELRRQVVELQQGKRKKLWLSAGFTSLLVYFMISFGVQLFPGPAHLLPLVMFFTGAELIVLSIVLLAGGLGILTPHSFGNPIAMASWMVMGAIVTCSSAVNAQSALSPPSMLYSGTVISAALVLHLLFASRLGHLQEAVFAEEVRQLDEEIEELEKKLESAKSR